MLVAYCSRKKIEDDMIRNLLQKMKKERVLENRYETYVAVLHSSNMYKTIDFDDVGVKTHSKSIIPNIPYCFLL